MTPVPRPGYEAGSYGVDSLIHSGELYDALNTSTVDIDFYRDRCSAAGTALELCCGTGRLTIPIALAGVDIIGVDIERSMLDRARLKARSAGVELSLYLADIREMRLDRTFGLVFIPFNSLQNFYSLDEVEKVFSTVMSHLRDDGVFILNVFNPDLRLMIDRSSGYSEQYRGILDNGRTVTVLEKCAYDAAAQVNRVSWKFNIEGEEPVTQRLDMRCFYPLEMRALLKYNGFEITEVFGDFDSTPFTSTSPRQIFVCRKA